MLIALSCFYMPLDLHPRSASVALYFPLRLRCLFITCYFRCFFVSNRHPPSSFQLTLHSYFSRLACSICPTPRTCIISSIGRDQVESHTSVAVHVCLDAKLRERDCGLRWYIIYSTRDGIYAMYHFLPGVARYPMVQEIPAEITDPMAGRAPPAATL